MSIKDIYMESKEGAQPTPQPKPALNRKELAADAIAFLSIVGAYLFITVTLHFNIFENYLGIQLDNYPLIVLLYLLYAAFILILQGLSILQGFRKTKVGAPVTQTINNEVRASLLHLLLISSLYILVHCFVKEITLEEFCHVAVWLWIGEISRILGSFLGQITGIDSLSYWGTSIVYILFLGGVLEGINAGIFELL